jgi:beta-catenin-like protein 1
MDALQELEESAYRGQGAEAPSASSDPPGKRQRMDKMHALSAAELLAEAERELAESQEEVVQQVDANSMKRMVLSVERKINANMQMRMKYPDRPEKFMDSELELYQELKQLHSLATTPELFPNFVKTKCIPSLLGLLAHENSDIASDVIDLFHELTDADDADPADSLALTECLLENSAPTLLMQRLDQLDESDDDEAAVVHATLSIFEALLEARPAAATELAQDAGLMKWLLKRLKTRAFHANKLYASELLAVLLQQNASNQLHLGSSDGILSLLTAGSHYKRKEPQDLEEAELVENTFDCLSAVLRQPANQLLFLKAEGIELMVLTIKEGRFASRGALKALDAALQRNGANCERFVDIRGFKTVFPLLGTPPPPLPAFIKGKGEKRAAAQNHDQHCASVAVTLFHQLTAERRLRLVGKFVENDMAKLDRLLQLRRTYDERIAEAEGAALRRAAAEGDDEEAVEERLYLARQEAGGYTWQLVDVCLAYVAGAKQKALCQRLMDGLYEAESSLHDVWTNADELIRGLVGGGDASEQRHIAEMSATVQALLARYAAANAAAASDAGADASADPEA